MTAAKIRVWDIGVRVFHWSLVIAYTVAYISGEEESSLHANAGYVVGGLIAFRLLWGFIGSRYARFNNFIYSPATTLNYLRSLLQGKPQHYLGHNPLGGWMIVALLVSLSLATWSGLEAYGSEGHGPLAINHSNATLISQAIADDDEHEHRGKHTRENGDEFWEEVHEVFANLTLLLVILHIAGVVIASLAHRENLVRAMVTGYKDEKSD